ncbi:YjjG family noncanonical pyrimidine nucleotidase [Planomicrobium sp. MB-3u-38]|uniref:YjjG family noncanonical pyrimidine nucleotidase n=1 Tax=Planomicrobium sp. MB-3u-38 TaxID=2058318 RepID=UPI000C7CFCAF|nr:YjjG family noncanonical pyrimidine nucleotidase [Planomicrobium sp. MB-3u-38]PKH10092.1 noncanonical pyrimidine nucleotidase, YjjG family [Planomicrobium sp. MB-3u-38]
MKEQIYTTIIFDIDDTLMDFALSEQAALHNTFMEFDLPNGFMDMHASYRAISKVLWQDLEQGNIALRELGIERFRRLFLEHRSDKDPIAFSSAYLSYLGKEAHLMAGALEVLEQLSHCRLVIMTNGFGEVQTSRLKNSDLGQHFDHIVISEEAGYQKPDPGIFEFAFSKIGVEAKENAIIVGDSLTSDIQGGINYGIDTIWFNPSAKKNDSPVEPTFEIRDLLEIIDIVNGSFTQGKVGSK